MAFNASKNTLDGGQFDNLISQLYAQNAPMSSSGSQFQPTPAQNAQYYDGQATAMNHPPTHGYQPGSVPSALPTTLSQNQSQPHQSAAAMNPNMEVLQRANSQSNSDRTASLLNLLKFSGPGSNQAAPISLPQTTSTITEGRSSFGAAPVQASADGRNTPSTDLMAALMGNSYAKPAQQSQSQASSRVPSSSFRPQSNAPPQDTQNFLLQLLNRPKPAQSSASPSQDTPKAQATHNKDISTSDVAELSHALEQSTIENTRRPSAKLPVPVVFGSSSEATTPAKNLFTYQNPFDELARSSPRNRTSRQATPAESAAPTPSMQILKHPRHNPTSEIDGYSRNSDERGHTSSPAYTKRKLSKSNPSSPVPVLPDGRTEIEALIGIGASNKGKETVSEALNDVGEKVNKQVEAALEEAEKDEAQSEIEKDMREMMNAKTDKEFEASAQLAAQAIKKELDKDGNETILQDSMSGPVADAVKEIIDETAQGQVADNWENVDAEDGTPKEGSGHFVKVYNFPMRPFVSLNITMSVEDRSAMRTESAISIARLKKDFDQIDRTLVTATDTFMIYCMPKNGGIRIIHQGNGNNSKLFSNHDDRVFSIAASTSGDTEAIIGIGVSNTVYWAIMSQGDYDEDFLPETKSFALPPSQIHDGESPGVLKTRARKSGSHTDFFAVGRGKSIHIIQPGIILKDRSYFLPSGDRIVNTEKYLNDHGMVINTGKAGKDFTFSPDDSIVVSLDKAGKVKIWDVRPFTGKWVSSKKPVTTLETGEINEPLMTLITTSPSEKSWATSVMFVDKVKPYQKGGPLRYLIIGMKQNHTLQLWDLALGRAVQEINLPHEKESDAVCSVLYHPHTSIIVVGHPTRNSIFMIHLSSPKYALSRSQNQAEYMEHLVSRDPSSVRPDSTAVMSGIREFAFSTPDKGVLRSLDILQQPTSCNPSGSEPVLFELYAMHSKGITCMSIRQEDLGWSADNRVLNPIDAEKVGVVKLESLKTLSAVHAEPAIESNGGSPASSVRAVLGSHRASKDTVSRDLGKKGSNSRDRGQSSETLAAARTATPATRTVEKSAPKSNGSLPESGSSTEKPTRNRKKKNASATGSPLASQALKNETPTVEHPTLLTRNASPTKSQKSSVPDGVLAIAASEPMPPPVPQHSTGMDQRAIDDVVGSIAPEISRILKVSLDDLYKRVDEDRRIITAAADSKHEAVLRLVSGSLAENIPRTVEHSVHHVIETKVLPAVVEITSSTLSDHTLTLAPQISKSITKELHNILPDAVFTAFKNPALLNSVANVIAGVVVGQVENQVAATLEQSIMPTFSKVISKTAQSIVNEAQQHWKAQIQSLTYQHNKDTAQIAQLTQLVTNLSNTVSTMADVQTKFQEEFLKVQRQANSRRPTPSINSRSVASVQVQENPPVDEQLERALQAVHTALQANELEAAIVAWLQSGREEEIFRNFFSKIDTLEFIERLNPLILLSVATVVTKDLVEFEPVKKLSWVEKIFNCFPVQPGYFIPIDERIRAVLPNTMNVIETRLEEYYNRVSEESRGRSPLLGRLGELLTFARHIRTQYGLPAVN